MTARTIARLSFVAASLGTVGGCALLFGIPNLGDPENVATMKARFKATIQAELGTPAPLDWGPGFWRHYLGPNSVEFCGRPTDAPPAQRTYQINYYRGDFATIGEIEIVTPAHPRMRPHPTTAATAPCPITPPPSRSPVSAIRRPTEKPLSELRVQSCPSTVVQGRRWSFRGTRDVLTGPD